MAGTTVGRLNAILSANASQFNAVLDAASGKVSSVFGAINKKIAAFGVSLSIAGAAYFIKRMLDSVEVTANLATRLGISTEGLIGLQHAALMSGSSVEDLQAGLSKMTQNLGDAALQGGPVAKTLERIGLDAETLANLAPDDAFLEIADAISQIKNPGEQASTIVDIFGKNSLSLTQTLRLGKEAILALGAEAKRLGISFSNVDAEKVLAANDAIDRVSTTIKGLGQQLAIQLAPFIEAAANKFTEWATSGEVASKKVESALQHVIGVLAATVDTIQDLSIAWSGFQLLVLKAEKVLLDFPEESPFHNWSKDDVKKIDAQIASIEKLQNKKLLAPQMGEQIKKFISDLQIASQAAAEAAAPKPNEGAAKNFADISKAVSDLNEKLTQMRETIGMSESQIQVWKLAQAGASEATLELASDLAQEIDGLQRIIGNLSQLEGKGNFFDEFNDKLQQMTELLEAGEISVEALHANIDKLTEAFDKMRAAEAFKVFEEVQTPLEKLTESLRKLAQLRADDAITQETYDRARIRAINEQADALGNLNDMMRPKAIEFGTAEAFSASLPQSRLDLGQKFDAIVEQNKRQLIEEKRQVEKLDGIEAAIKDLQPIHVVRV